MWDSIQNAFDLNEFTTCKKLLETFEFVEQQEHNASSPTTPSTSTSSEKGSDKDDQIQRVVLQFNLKVTEICEALLDYNHATIHSLVVSGLRPLLHKAKSQNIPFTSLLPLVFNCSLASCISYDHEKHAKETFFMDVLREIESNLKDQSSAPNGKYFYLTNPKIEDIICTFPSNCFFMPIVVVSFVCLMREGFYNRAEKLLTNVLDLDYDDLITYLLAILYFKMGNLSQSFDVIKRIKIEEQQKEELVNSVLYLRSLLSYLLGDHSLSEFQGDLTRVSTKPQTLILEGCVLYKQGKTTEATQKFSQAIFLSKDSTSVMEGMWNMVIYFTDQCNWGDALYSWNTLQKTFSLSNTSDQQFLVSKRLTMQDIEFIQANCKAKMGKWEDAIKIYERIIDTIEGNRIEPQTFSIDEIYQIYIYGLLIVSKYEEAYSACKRILNYFAKKSHLDGGSKSVGFSLDKIRMYQAECALFLSRPNEMQTILEECVDMDESDRNRLVILLNNKSLSLLCSGNTSEALSLLQRAWSLDPKPVIVNYVLLLIKSGKVEEGCYRWIEFRNIKIDDVVPTLSASKEGTKQTDQVDALVLKKWLEVVVVDPQKMNKIRQAEKMQKGVETSIG